MRIVITLMCIYIIRPAGHMYNVILYVLHAIVPRPNPHAGKRVWCTSSDFLGFQDAKQSCAAPIKLKLRNPCRAPRHFNLPYGFLIQVSLSVFFITVLLAEYFKATPDLIIDRTVMKNGSLSHWSTTTGHSDNLRSHGQNTCIRVTSSAIVDIVEHL